MKKRSSGRRRMPSSIAVHSEFADAIGEGTAATFPAERPAIPTTFGSAIEEYTFLDQQKSYIGPIDPNDQEAMGRYERMQKLWPMVQDEIAQARMERAKAASKPEDVEHALELISILASGLRTFGFRQKASNALDALLVGNENYCLLERLAILGRGYWIEVYDLANNIVLDYFASSQPGTEAYSKEKQQEHARLLEAYVEEIRQSDAIVHGQPKTAPPAVEGSEQQTPSDESRQPDPVATGPAKTDTPAFAEIERKKQTEEILQVLADMAEQRAQGRRSATPSNSGMPTEAQSLLQSDGKQDGIDDVENESLPNGLTENAEQIVAKQTREQRELAFDEAIAGYDASKWKRDPDLNNKAWRVRSGNQKGELFGGEASERGWYQSKTRKQVIKKDEDGVWVCLTASHSKKLEIFLGLFDS